MKPPAAAADERGLALPAQPAYVDAMRVFPAEFSDLLSPAGQRVLAGTWLKGVLSDPQRRFCHATNLLKTRSLPRLVAALDRDMAPCMQVLEAPIDPGLIYDQTRNYSEQLPKVMKQHTAYLASTRSRAYARAQELGVVAMLRSDSFFVFCEQLAGVRLRRRHGIQLLSYEAGDYVGPHTDHHPEEPLAQDGYVDVHVTLSNRGVREQLLVVAKQGHFRDVYSMAASGTVTGYRLPVWHYTTPLQAQAQTRTQARRWVLLGTFLFAQNSAPRATTRGGVRR